MPRSINHSHPYETESCNEHTQTNLLRRCWLLANLVEPREQSKETMDEVCGIYCKLFELAHSDPETLHTAPHSTPVRRLDEVGAARNMVLRYQFA